MDPDIAPVLEWKEKGSRPSGQEVAASSPATKHYWLTWGLLSIEDGVLLRKFAKRDGTGEYNQIITPRSMQKELLYLLHKGKLGGHLGRRRTMEHLLQNYYWHDVRTDVELYVQQCEECQRVKEPSKRPRAPLGEMPVGGPLDRVATDILGPLPTSMKGNNYVLVATDHFTKWVEILPIPDMRARTCADYLLNEVFARFGTPLTLHSDQGTNYESKIIADLCHMLDICKTRTSPGRPQGNGQTERFNRTLIRMVKCFLKGEQTHWDRHLGCLAGAYRQSRHDSTGMTPNLMMLGREVRSTAELRFGVNKKQGNRPPTMHVQEIREKLQHAHDIARVHLKNASRRNKLLFDKKAAEEKYNIGDLVWYETHQGQKHITPKLRTPYQGPFMVYQARGVNYEILLHGGIRNWVHHNRLKRYQGIKFPPGYFQALQAAKAEEKARQRAGKP